MELKIPPVIVLLVAAAAIASATFMASELNLAVPGQRTIGIGIAILACAFAAPAVLSFRQARTTVHPMKPQEASQLVCEGLYRYSRNPMYLGMLLLLVAQTVFTGSLAGLAVLPAFAWYMTRFQIVPEERALTARFGPDYTAYCARVRRWL